MPFSYGPKQGIHFPIECIVASLEKGNIYRSALEIGCAVGRSSFELARYCEKVIAIDSSQKFIAAAKAIQSSGQLDYQVVGEAGTVAVRVAKRPSDIDFHRITFKYCDAMELFEKPVQHDLVLGVNVLCRMSEPELFLSKLHLLVNTGGTVILASPYSWLEEFTAKSKWLSFKDIQNILEGHFRLERTFDLPFLIRDHYRKYEWGVSQFSVWRRTK